MRDFQNPFANGAYNHILSFSRSLDLRGRPTAWSGEAWYWNGIQGAWSNLQFLSRELSSPWNGPVATADVLTAALVSHGVPSSAVRPFGAHTLVTLENISFVYRAKHYKGDGDHLLVAPHLPGKPFGACGHTWIHPFAPLSDFAELMLWLDRSVPLVRDACRDAVADAARESAERSIKTQAAAVMLTEVFGGAIPDNVTFYVDGLRHPADINVVRLDIRHGAEPWEMHRVDIPLDLPRECWHSLPDLLSDPGFPHAVIDPFLDDDTGETVPVLVSRDFAV